MTIRSQTEEMLWIAAQEDHVIPAEIVRFAASKNISILKIMEYTKEDFVGVSAQNIKKFFEMTEKIDVQKYRQIWDNLQLKRTRMIFYDDYDFPKKLRAITTISTILLYHDGLDIPFEKCVAVVGTRNCSTHAAEFTRDLSQRLAKEGFVVVAGLALGIDTIAHRGALSGGGKTIAVLPWMNNPTPKSNAKLLDEIKQNGFAISDTFCNTEGMMAKGKFIHRNEIISGISNYVIAVESGMTGGTRHQVEIAMKQGKTVMTLEPQHENKAAYDGFEKFIELGALPVTCPDDVFGIMEKHISNKQVNTTLANFQ